MLDTIGPIDVDLQIELVITIRVVLQLKIKKFLVYEEFQLTPKGFTLYIKGRYTSDYCTHKMIEKQSNGIIITIYSLSIEGPYPQLRRFKKT